MDELLSILKENALESPDNIAKMLNISVDEVRKRIAEYEKRGIIKGYQALVNVDALNINRVTALIEVKVSPEREGGFNRIANRIGKFPEVQSIYLISGDFDLLLFVVGADLKEVAFFVSEKLATIEGVQATASHFMLKTYKHHGVLMEAQDEYERLKVTP